MKKFLLLFSFFSVCGFITACAGDCGSCGYRDNSGDCKACECWSFEADWLYWKTRKCNLEYTMEHNAISGQEAKYIIENPSDVDLNYDSGYRLAIMRRSPCFNLGVRYSYYSTDHEDKTTSSRDNLLGTRIGSVHYEISKDLSYAKSEYDLTFKRIDVEIGKDFAFCNTLLTFFGGVSGVLIDQKLETLYSDQITNPRSGNNESIKESNDMWSWGLFVGTEGVWDWCGFMNLFGNISFGSLLADFDRKFIEYGDSDSGSRYKNAYAKEDEKCYIFNLAYSIGVETTFCDLFCFDLFIRAGYESSSFFGMHDFIYFVDDRLEGHQGRGTETLGFDGFFVKLSCDF